MAQIVTTGGRGKDASAVEACADSSESDACFARLAPLRTTIIAVS
jgi:hypothetical protein